MEAGGGGPGGCWPEELTGAGADCSRGGTVAVFRGETLCEGSRWDGGFTGDDRPAARRETERQVTGASRATGLNKS